MTVGVKMSYQRVRMTIFPIRYISWTCDLQQIKKFFDLALVAFKSNLEHSGSFDFVSESMNSWKLSDIASQALWYDSREIELTLEIKISIKASLFKQWDAFTRERSARARRRIWTLMSIRVFSLPVVWMPVRMATERLGRKGPKESSSNLEKLIACLNSKGSVSEESHETAPDSCYSRFYYYLNFNRHL